jgi:hypothetical protein
MSFCELIDVFSIVEKCQMRRTGAINRSKASNALASTAAVPQLSSSQRRYFSKRRPGRLFEERQLRHPTRRGAVRDKT